MATYDTTQSAGSTPKGSASNTDTSPFAAYNEKIAAADLSRYRKDGPRPWARALIEAIEAEGVEGATLLDIGGGIGVIQWFANLRRALRPGGKLSDLSLVSLTRPMVMGRDLEDAVRLVAETPQAKGLFAGQPRQKIDAAIQALRTGFAPFEAADGVVTSGKAWLLTASR